MTDHPVRISWNGSIGPAFIGLIMQTFLLMGGGIMYYSSLQNTVSNTKAAADSLAVMVREQERRSDGIGERLIAVETKLQNVSEIVAKVDTKIDTLKAR